MTEIKDMILFLMRKGLVKGSIDIDLLSDEFNRVRFDLIHGLSDIVDVVCYVTGVEKALLFEETRETEVRKSRQLSMYFLEKYTKLGLKDVGSYFYNPKTHHVFDHATVSHSKKTVKNLYETEPNFKALVDDIEDQIKIKLNIKE